MKTCIFYFSFGFFFCFLFFSFTFQVWKPSLWRFPLLHIPRSFHSWKADSTVKSACCSFRKSEIISQHSHYSSQLFINSISEAPMGGHQAYTWYLKTSRQNNNTHKINIFKNKKVSFHSIHKTKRSFLKAPNQRCLRIKDLYTKQKWNYLENILSVFYEDNNSRLVYILQTLI